MQDSSSDQISTTVAASSEETCQIASILHFAAQHKCRRIIKRILLANNGNAAAKCLMSLRAWSLRAFGNDHHLEIVGMASVDDMNSNAEFIAKCDFVAKVPGGSDIYNYANVDLIKEIAEEWNCDAVWPGWGHASEDYRLPKVLKRGSRPVAWIGPPPSAMEALGCKIGSTIIAQTIGVPVVPWTGPKLTALETPKHPGQYYVTRELREQACVSDARTLIDMVTDGLLGFPLMIKAAAGGGGKGIRVVHSKEAIELAYRHVINEVKGSLVFAMKLITRCRHLEVQILADEYGDAVSLGTRDCTIQRRHQKIIEEGPPICCNSKTLRNMEDHAVQLVKAVGYTNAGTVEFLYDLDTEQYYFLEVNARLQVEHVVTEMLANVNLPAAQVCVAMGLPLDSIEDVSSYLKARNADPSLIADRHCIAARVTAEDVDNNFQPTCGEVRELSFDSSPNVWAYFSIGSSSRIHAYSDSQFGHIFATCATREDARNGLLLCLRSLCIRGEISTNVEALQYILESDDFIHNKTCTTWLEKVSRFTRAPATGSMVTEDVLTAVLYAGLYRATRQYQMQSERFISRIKQGQVPKDISVEFSTELVYRNAVKFHLTMYLLGPNEVRVSMNGSQLDFEFAAVTPPPAPATPSALDDSTTNSTNPSDSNVMISSWYFVSGGLDGRHRQVGFQEYPKQEALRVTITSKSQTFQFTKERDPSQIRAPFAAKLVRWLVSNGAVVQGGTAFAEIEIMKMYLQLTADDQGVITHVLSEGAVFQPGDLLATLELPEGADLQRPVLYTESLPMAISGRRQT